VSPAFQLKNVLFLFASGGQEPNVPAPRVSDKFMFFDYQPRLNDVRLFLIHNKSRNHTVVPACSISSVCPRSTLTE